MEKKSKAATNSEIKSIRALMKNHFSDMAKLFLRKRETLVDVRSLPLNPIDVN